jgi:hypothetical protein
MSTITKAKLPAGKYRIDTSLLNKESGTRIKRSLYAYALTAGLAGAGITALAAHAGSLSRMTFSNPMAASINNYETQTQQVGNINSPNAQDAVLDPAPDRLQ